ncbi:hypothetical protein AOC05_10260 [Arthrobacter alpinus]|uniref:Major facilitator superfamily (MFS) profile domain-containing protein n=1 Tax=Arthrobacter alpinus TaxID=656366 RepID=A0A0M5LXG9_9MICC|nr:MFS transporter [Arthrobacter alpinus]ALE92600.1 hypothetical protein AOC05_10260 [Arthrobacter alpinus]
MATLDPANASRGMAESLPKAALPQSSQPAPVSRAWLWHFALAWFGFWLLVMLPGQFMVAKISATVSPENKVGVASFLIAETAIVILLSVPVIGVLCDRTSSRFARRRSWVLAGFATAAVPFALVGLQTNWVIIALLVAVVALGEAAVLVALSAMIADQVPVNRASLRHAITLPRPSGYPGYYWAMASRVLIHAGNLVGTTYLFFFLSDVLGVKNPDDSLLILILIYLVACGFTSWLGGVLSDRWRRRRIFIALAAGLQGAAALLLAAMPTWDASMVAAVLLGLGFGMFLSVDQALVTDLLPNPETRGRDLGLVNTAQHIPIAPIVGWLVLSVAGYRSLYLVAAVIMLAGGLAVYRIKNVR